MAPVLKTGVVHATEGSNPSSSAVRFPMWSPPAIQCLLDAAREHGDASEIQIGPYDWADLRKWGRDHLRIEDRIELLRKGIFGYFDGVPVHVMRGLQRRSVSVIDSGGRALTHSWLDGVVHSGPLQSCSAPDCVVRLVMEG